MSFLLYDIISILSVQYSIHSKFESSRRVIIWLDSITFFDFGNVANALNIVCIDSSDTSKLWSMSFHYIKLYFQIETGRNVKKLSITSCKLFHCVPLHIPFINYRINCLLAARNKRKYENLHGWIEKDRSLQNISLKNFPKKYTWWKYQMFRDSCWEYTQTSRLPQFTANRRQIV